MFDRHYHQPIAELFSVFLVNKLWGEWGEEMHNSSSDISLG